MNKQDLAAAVADSDVVVLIVPVGLTAEHRPDFSHLDAATEAVAAGFGTIYLKSGFERRKDAADVAAVREAIGFASKLRIDPNEAWSPAEAITIIHELEPYELEFVEQPVSMYDLDGLARVRRAVRTPVASMSMRPLMGMVHAFVTPGSFTASFISAIRRS